MSVTTSLNINPILPVCVPQRHTLHKIVCNIYVNEVNSSSFGDFSSWNICNSLTKSLFKIFKFSLKKICSNWGGYISNRVRDSSCWVHNVISCVIFAIYTVNLPICKLRRITKSNFQKNCILDLVWPLKGIK